MGYKITVKGFQEYLDDGCENDKIELTTEADFKYENSLYYIDYEESLMSDEGTSHTNMEIGADYVAMNRTGSINSEMLFINGKRTNSVYATPYGTLNISIYTTRLDIDVSDDGGRIYIEYIIDINNNKVSKNSFEIYITEVNDK